jgi:putative inorganic carbon (HCO3(-)) transporter
MIQAAFLAVCAICIGGGLVWAVWRLDPAVVFCAGIAALMFSAHWGDLGFPSGIPVKPDRLLLFASFAMVLLRTPGAAGRPAIRLGPIHLVLVATLGYAVASAWLAGTLGEQTPLFSLIDRFGLLPFLAFTLVPAMFYTSRRRRMLVMTLVAMGGYLGITAIFEIINFKAGIFPSYITDPNVGITYGRARGPFVQSTALGLVLFAGLAACGVGLADRPSPRVKALLYLVAGLCLVGSLMTLTRAIWIGVIASSILAAAFSPPLRRRLVPLAAVAGIGVVVALVAIPGLHDRATARTEDQRPVWDRYNSNAAALRIVDAKPLFGVGYGRYHEINGRYLRQGPSYPLTGVGLEVHNVTLGNIAELGLVGGMLWGIAVLAGVFAPMLRRLSPRDEPWRLALIAVGVDWFIVGNFVPLGYPLPNMLIWTLAGVVVGLRAPAAAPAPVPVAPPARFPIPAAVS